MTVQAPEKPASADREPQGGLPALPRTQVVMLAAVAGIALGLLIIYADRLSWDTPTRKFALTGAFQFWVAVVAARTMPWTLALPPLVAILRRHRADGSARREAIPSAVVLTVLVAILVEAPRQVYRLPDFLPYREVKIDILSAFALGVALVATTSIWLIRGRAESLGKQTFFTGDDLTTYLVLRSDLELLYGPTFLSLQRTGSRIRERSAPVVDPTDAQFESRLARRNAIDGMLGLNLSASHSFRTGVAILTPLLGSLTSLIPKLGG